LARSSFLRQEIVPINITTKKENMKGIVKKILNKFNEHMWVVHYDNNLPNPKLKFGWKFELDDHMYPIYPNQVEDGTLYQFQEVEFEVINNYGICAFDNQVPGIDYYDVAKITKKHKCNLDKLTDHQFHSIWTTAAYLDGYDKKFFYLLLSELEKRELIKYEK
jgi:hypothetical protein